MKAWLEQMAALSALERPFFLSPPLACTVPRAQGNPSFLSQRLPNSQFLLWP